MKPTLHICGPASGSLTFSFPQLQRASDDAFILPSSECELAEGQVVFRLNRISDGALTRIRAGLYRQAFEPGMSRLGHSFGPVFEFVDEVPLGATLAQTLVELLEFIRLNCAPSGVFCSLDQFTRFLESEIEPGFNGIVRQLNPAHTKRIAGLKIAPGVGLHCFRDMSPGSIDEVGALFDWFASDRFSLSCETLLIGANLTVGNMVRPLVVDVTARTTLDILYSEAERLQSALAEATDALRDLQSSAATAQREFSRLTHDRDLAQEEARHSLRRVQILEAKINTLEADRVSLSSRAERVSVHTRPAPPNFTPHVGLERDRSAAAHTHSERDAHSRTVSSNSHAYNSALAAEGVSVALNGWAQAVPAPSRAGTNRRLHRRKGRSGVLGWLLLAAGVSLLGAIVAVLVRYWPF